MMNKSLDERFTDIADVISEKMGKWYVSVISLFLVIVWTIYCIITQGPGWWYGTFYNLPLNLVTTLAELWIGFLIAAAANRVEKRNRLLHEQMFALEQKIIDLVTKEEQELVQIEQELQPKGKEA